MQPRKPQSWPWEIPTWHRIFPRYRIISVLFPMQSSRKSAPLKLFLVKLLFADTCRSAFPTSLSVAPASSGRHKSQRKDPNMRMLKLLDDMSPLLLTLAFTTMLILPACNVNVRKNSEGQDKKVDI